MPGNLVKPPTDTAEQAIQWPCRYEYVLSFANWESATGGKRRFGNAVTPYRVDTDGRPLLVHDST
jgi:hypothetical protein